MHGSWQTREDTATIIFRAGLDFLRSGASAEDSAASVRNILRALHQISKDDRDSLDYCTILVRQLIPTPWHLSTVDLLREEDLLGGLRAPVRDAWLGEGSPLFLSFSASDLPPRILEGIALSKPWSKYVYQSDNLPTVCQILAFGWPKNRTVLLDLVRRDPTNPAWKDTFRLLLALAGDPELASDPDQGVTYESLLQVLAILKLELGLPSPEFEVPDPLAITKDTRYALPTSPEHD
jgi:hypothetical protein